MNPSPYKFNYKLAHLIYRMCHAFQNGGEIKAMRKNNSTEWDFVPSGIHYIEQLVTILKKERIQITDPIIDLGCGVSPILSYLYEVGFTKLHGIDNISKYVYMLREVLKWSVECNIQSGDLCNLTDRQKELIGDCKVIYTYMPLTDTDKFNDWLLSIIPLMSSGSILISFYCVDYKRLRDSNLVKERKLNLKSYNHSLTYYKKL